MNDVPEKNPEENSEKVAGLKHDSKNKGKSVDKNLVKSVFEKKVSTDESVELPIGSVKAEVNTRPKKESRVQVKDKKNLKSKKSFMSGMRFMQASKSKVSLGVDIGFNSVKIIELTEHRGRPVITKIYFREFTTQSDAELFKQLYDSLPRVLKAQRSNAKVYACLQEGMAQIRRISLPEIPLKELHNALKYELAQAEQEPGASELVYDFVVLNDESITKDNKIDLLVVSASEKQVIDHYNLLKSLGLKPLSIEVDTLAWLNALSYSQLLPKDEIVLLLDFGGNGSRLNIIRNENLHYSRSINVSGNSLTKSIMGYFSISFEEAEQLKREFFKKVTREGWAIEQMFEGNPVNVATEDGEVGEDQLKALGKEEMVDRVASALSLSMKKLITDIKHTFKYYSFQMTKSEVKSFQRIIISGGSSMMLLPYFEQSFDVPVEVDNPLEGIEMKENICDELTQSKLQEPYRFGVALGLALRAFQKE